jgi:uncharacterized protein (DUF1015 family)
MPEIHPFKGLRYNISAAGKLEDLTAPPYDIIFDEWRDRLYERNPYNIIRLIKTKDEPGDNETSNKYTRAASFLDKWLADGILKIDEKPSVYVCSDTYNLDGETLTRTGFISLIKLEQFGKSIHPHERTLSGPKVDRLNLVKATGTNLSQVFSVYEDPDGKIQSILLKVSESKPDVDFVDEQEVGRKMWIVQDSEIIAKLQKLMSERDVIIADGHHRYETALAYKELNEPNRKNETEPFDFVSMYFSSTDAAGMTILPTHRKAGGMENWDERKFLDELDKYFYLKPRHGVELEKLLEMIKVGSEKTNVFGIVTKNGFYEARFMNPPDPKELDVDVLHNLIIENILGISADDIAKGKYLKFSKSHEYAYNDVVKGADQIAFFMNALTAEEMFREILKGRRLPQKTTYFFPKTISGVVMYKIDRESLG